MTEVNNSTRKIANMNTPTNLLPKSEIKWDLLPSHLTSCIVADCPFAGGCLRYLSYHYSKPDDYAHSYLHPRRASIGRDCQYYLPNHLSTLPLGFTRGLGLVPSAYANQIRLEIMAECGISKAAYYRWRRGKRIISEQERDILIGIFGRYKVKAEQIFDSEIERYPSYYSRSVDSKV